MSDDPGLELFDAGRRLAEAVTLALLGQGTGVVGRWVAARLSDGGTDGVIYDTKADAVRHQLHEMQCAYLRIPPDGITPKGAATYLKFTRTLYESGHRLGDPDRHTEMPARVEDFRPGLVLPPVRRARA